ncbi:MAG: hypothetical protein WC479_07235 [Candidatus Izemoplasmatales bacterium]
MISNMELLKLLKDIRPEMQIRIDEMNKLWPGKEVLLELHRCESLLSRINEALGNTVNMI